MGIPALVYCRLYSPFLLASQNVLVKKMETLRQFCRTGFCVYTGYIILFQIQDAALSYYAFSIGNYFYSAIPAACIVVQKGNKIVFSNTGFSRYCHDTIGGCIELLFFQTG